MSFQKQHFPSRQVTLLHWARTSLALLVWALLPVPTQAANATEFVVTAGADGNQIVFESHAPLESFEGKTQNVSGRIRLDPQALADSLDIYLEVDLASLDTGIGKRNRHMRENHLHTDKYPKAVFRGAKFLDPPAKLVPGVTIQLQGQGQFEIHGVVKDDLKFVVDLTLAETPTGSTLTVVAKFEVHLADFEIPRPKFLFVKLNETQLVTAKMVGHLTAK